MNSGKQVDNDEFGWPQAKRIQIELCVVIKRIRDKIGRTVVVVSSTG